uniref:Uncharacterized protein n=1 Tax=Esox lucius TaxID=8010 RepID=A0A3P8Z8N4_ESOLU
MSKSKDPRKSKAMFELNMRRETWCRVDNHSKWERAENRHFDCHLRSSWDFKSLQAVTPEQRSGWTAGLAHPKRNNNKKNYKNKT